MQNATHAHRPSAGETRDSQRRGDGRLYVQQVRAFRVHASVFAGSVVIIFLVNLAVNVGTDIADEWWAWWSGLALLGWGLGVTIHGLVVRMSRSRTFG
jgi:hypothetical protein